MHDAQNSAKFGYVEEMSLPLRETLERDFFMYAVWQAGYQKFERVFVPADDPKCVCVVWRFSEIVRYSEDTIKAIQMAKNIVAANGEKIRCG